VTLPRAYAVNESQLLAAGLGLREDSIALFDDCYKPGSALTEISDWASTAVNGANAAVAAATIGIDATNRAEGVYSLATGTTDTGRAAIRSSGNVILLSRPYVELSMRVLINQFSTVSEEFSFSVGFNNNINGATLNAVDGAWFRYHRLVDGDFWACLTASESNADPTSPTNTTKTVTAVAPARSSTSERYQVLTIRILAGSVQFLIDGVVVATHTTHLPIVGTTGFGLRIFKSAGTTSRLAYIDWMRFLSTRGAR
jgi:hypothetical protein